MSVTRNQQTPSLTDEQRTMLSMVLNGECSMAFVLGWAERNDMAEFAAYVRTF